MIVIFPALLQEFGSTCWVARAEDGIRGYVNGLGRRLYTAFAEAAERHGARRLKATTSVENTGSITFHRSLGIDTKTVDDYNGPGRTMVVFHRDLPLDVSRP